MELSRHLRPLTRKLVWLIPVFALSISACGGYTLVRKKELMDRPTKVVVDSSTIVVLRQQIAALQAQVKADSIRYANSPNNKAIIAEKDNIIRQRDTEITSLKEQLSKALDELDRIKRRLAVPSK